MTKVTNIYIDTVGFTDEQYDIANRTIDELKTGQRRGWLGRENPKYKDYRVLTLDCDGDRGYYDNVPQMRQSLNSCDCNPVLLSDLVEIEMRARYERSLKLGKFRIIVDGKSVNDNGQSITAADRMTPKNERAIVNGLMDALLSNRLISKMAHGVVAGAMQGYYSANDTQP